VGTRRLFEVLVPDEFDAGRARRSSGRSGERGRRAGFAMLDDVDATTERVF
jgi:hypothetical protein